MLLICPFSCWDDGSHFRVQGFVAGQYRDDYAAVACVSVRTCMHLHICRWKMMVVWWGYGSRLGFGEPVLSSCVCHMVLAGQLSFFFHFSLPVPLLPQAESGDEDILFLLKRFALSLDVWFLSEHCLEMTEFSYLVRKGGWFPLLPPSPENTSSLPSPCFYVYACFQINHTLFLIWFLACSSAFLLARLTVFLS